MVPPPEQRELVPAPLAVRRLLVRHPRGRALDHTHPEVTLSTTRDDKLRLPPHRLVRQVIHDGAGVPSISGGVPARDDDQVGLGLVERPRVLLELVMDVLTLAIALPHV